MYKVRPHLTRNASRFPLISPPDWARVYAGFAKVFAGPAIPAVNAPIIALFRLPVAIYPEINPAAITFIPGINITAMETNCRQYFFIPSNSALKKYPLGSV